MYVFALKGDHARFLLGLRQRADVTRASAWAAPWDSFGEFGLSEELWCGNAVGTQ